MPKKKYPIQTWTDPVILAGLLRYFIARKTLPRSRSDLVASSLELLHDALVTEGKLGRFLSPEEAVSYLQAHDLGPGSKAQREAAVKILSEAKD